MNIESMGAVGMPQRSMPAEASSAVRQATPQGRPVEKAPASTDKLGQPLEKREKVEPSREEVDQAVDRLSKFVSTNQSEINFSVDQSSGVRVVKVIDRNSNEVIRQMPSEEAVALAQALDKLQGLLVKDKA